MFYSLLPNRSILSLTGENTIEFLQGLISNDARKLLDGSSIYTALLSPQGKFLHDFFLIPWQEKIFIDVQTSRANDLLTKLKLYRLRSKIEIELDESLTVAVIWNEELDSSTCNNEFYKIYQDPRLPELGLRIVGNKDIITQALTPPVYNSQYYEEYEHFRLSLAVPDTRDMIVEKSLLLECGFEQLHGVDFSKGCYIGQEVTTRSKFRGQVRKSFYSVTSSTDLPISGTKIMVDDKIIGEIRTSLGKIGIALIYNDEYEIAINNKIPILCNKIEIEITYPRWIKNSK